MATLAMNVCYRKDKQPLPQQAYVKKLKGNKMRRAIKIVAIDARSIHWAIARKLVESYNRKFIGVLQPVAFFSNTRLDHLELDNSRRKQYQLVYPLIKAG